MIKSKFMFFVIGLLSLTQSNLFAQLNQESIWAISTREIHSTSGELTTNSSLNSLLEQYNVNHFEFALENAKNPELQLMYEIKCEACDYNALYDELVESYSEVFTKIKINEYENLSLYEPTDWLWVDQQDGWLWHLKKIQSHLAWDLTLGNPNIRVAVIDTDFDISHPDLATEIFPLEDPYDNQPFDCQVFNSHGTSVAGYVAGETTEQGQTAQGQMASVGFNTTMMCYKAWAGNYLQRAHHAAMVMNANIVTSSAGGWSPCPDLSGIDEMIVKEILDNGTTIVMPAGNGVNGTHNTCSSVDGNNHIPFFPLSPYYDERVIIVTSTGPSDNHLYMPNGNNATHSHYPMVDLCAPGYETIALAPSDCGNVTWPYAGNANGTSFASPIVAGVAALMYDVNPCMTPALCQDILKNTTDPVVDAANFPDGVGTGRVNAFEAVKVAQDMYSSGLDLYIKDRVEDFGNEQFPYHWQAPRDESPDIWVRNQADGFDNQEHQQPEYNSGNDVYVYVKVRNKGCLPSQGTETINLYWTKASSMTSWPQNWDGTDPNVGDLIGSIQVGSIPPGTEKIFEFQWDIIDPYIHQNWSSCLMARIENSQVDDITIYPGNAADDVFYNNNIALKNVTVTDITPGIVLPSPGLVDGIYYPHGSNVYIGNAEEVAHTFDFAFKSDDPDFDITKRAEVKLIFDSEGWEHFQPKISENKNFKIVREREVIVLNGKSSLESIGFLANKRYPIYVGFSFLTDKKQDVAEEYMFHLEQFFSSTGAPAGGQHFKIQDNNRQDFQANAGADKEIKVGNLVNLDAYDIGEAAYYLWYDENGNFISNNKSIEVSPDVTTKYSLEVIAKSDSYKDYDDVLVTVLVNYITEISPNPTSDMVNISYTINDGVESASLVLVHETTQETFEYPIEPFSGSHELNIESLASGTYAVMLKCDEKYYDSESLVKI